MSDAVTGPGEGPTSIRTIAIMALVPPLFGGLAVFVFALALFGEQVPAAQLFSVVMIFAIALGVPPGVVVGIFVARADRRGGASWSLALGAGLASGILAALVLFYVNDGLPLPPLVGTVAIAIVSVCVGFAWTRALRAGMHRPAR
mgnify:CR=1 FL=1